MFVGMTTKNLRGFNWDGLKILPFCENRYLCLELCSLQSHYGYFVTTEKYLEYELKQFID